MTAVNNRVVICPMEPRAAIASYDPAEDRYTLRVCSQGVHRMQTLLARRSASSASRFVC